jgi:hypothetical protein
MDTEIIRLTHDYADVWIATDHQPSANYSYGGTRMVDPRMDDEAVQHMLERLMYYESALKNQLINNALSQGIRHKYEECLPAGFLQSRVGGARCLIRPNSLQIAAILQSPDHPAFQATIEPIFAKIGEVLNRREGKIKLTPDFGHFANLSNVLYQFTPHVLGISCEVGGCGGKTSYTSTGVIAAMETLGCHEDQTTPVTLIGAAGAMGSDILNYLQCEGFSDIAVCDIAYEANLSSPPPAPIITLPSAKNMFTDHCLRRGGVIIATTIGKELEHSHWQLIPSATKLLLAHNLSVPDGPEGIALMRSIEQQRVCALPGQLLTLGGALTSRLEWFWRQSRQEQPFDKQLAHTVVAEVVRFTIADVVELAKKQGQTLYEAMLNYAEHMTLMLHV